MAYVSDARARAILWPDERLVFIRGGWCERYTGDEWPIRGGAHNEQDRGNEYNNFRSHNGLCYVYVRARRNKPLTLARMQARGAQEVGHVTVVQVATHIEPTRGQVVVGWFRAAIAYAEWQERPYAPDEVCCFRAPVHLAHCLDPTERSHKVFHVPKGTEGDMGQSQVRYASDASGRLKMNDWMFRILAEIRRRESEDRRTHDAALRPGRRTKA